MIRQFIAVNQKVCNRIEPYLPQAKTAIIGDTYEKVVAKYMSSGSCRVVVDVGAGKSCPFAKYKNPALQTKIVGVDISHEELKHNVDVDEKRVANITRDLPFETEEISLITSRSVLEHLENVESFVANSRRVLTVGGYFIHLFPSKFAPFALINQLLPNFVVRKVLYFISSEAKGVQGFPAFYDRTYYSGIRKLLKQHNFKVISIHLGYYQSSYFNFFVPLFLVSALYEMLIREFGTKNLAPYVLVIARKE